MKTTSRKGKINNHDQGHSGHLGHVLPELGNSGQRTKTLPRILLQPPVSQ